MIKPEALAQTLAEIFSDNTPDVAYDLALQKIQQYTAELLNKKPEQD